MTMSNTEDQTRFETDPYLLTQIDPTLNDDRSIGYESDKSVTSNISTNSLQERCFEGHFFTPLVFCTILSPFIGIGHERW